MPIHPLILALDSIQVDGTSEVARYRIGYRHGISPEKFKPLMNNRDDPMYLMGIEDAYGDLRLYTNGEWRPNEPSE